MKLLVEDHIRFSTMRTHRRRKQAVLMMLSVLVTTFATAPASSSTRTTTTSSTVPRPLPHPRLVHKLVIGVDGGTESIRACCFDAETGMVIGKSCAVPYPTHHPQPGWAEQDPDVWYTNLGEAVRGAVASAIAATNNEPSEICAMALDTTCCSVLALDEKYRPLRPCLLWMDQRSAAQTATILRQCGGDPALSVNCGGRGPLSAEWMTPKALWIRNHEPEIWAQATTICEYQDWLNYKLTGILCASSCNAASRWHWDGEDCLTVDGNGRVVEGRALYAGRPISMYAALGIPELSDKLPRVCLPMGAIVGPLTTEAASHLGLTQGIPVVQGGPDAFVGMIGLGCIHPGQLCLITGSSHLHCVVTSHPTTAPGIWGAYRGAPLPGINFAEGGQASTGSIIRWAHRLFGGDDAGAGDSYKTLDQQAAQIAPGADGLIALETFQGSRTPVTDPLARGALLGLTLSHGRAHLWRALMEAVCYGTRSCVEGLSQAGHDCAEIVLAGGITRSDLWLQMHADVTGKPIVVCENADAPLLGCAILASVGAGIHGSIPDAVHAMVRTARRIEPNPAAVETYGEIYRMIYRPMVEAVRPISHALAGRNLPLKEASHRTVEPLADATIQLVGRSSGKENDENIDKSNPQASSSMMHNHVTVSPSLLACDWANIQREVHRCMDAHATRLHIDVFDGVFLESPRAFTFGPQMIQAIRNSCHDCRRPDLATPILDLHVCVQNPERYVETMAQVGGDRFVFQWEAMLRTKQAIDLANRIAQSGMRCGVSLNPMTPVHEIYPLLETGLVDTVDLLAVEPGFGGQNFQHHVLDKIRMLRDWRDHHSASHPRRLWFDIMVDGGINASTASDVVRAGANVLVSGTFLFRHSEGISGGVQALLTERS